MGAHSRKRAQAAVRFEESHQVARNAEFLRTASLLAEIGQNFYARGWLMGTSGNFSALVSREPLRLAITATGLDKSRLTADQIVIIEANGQSLQGMHRASAESALHVAIVQATGAGAVMHTHSVWSTLLSDIHGERGGFWIEGYEMLKGLEGVTTHDHREWIPIIENSQDCRALAQSIGMVLSEHPAAHAILLRCHGLYTWGRDLDAAKRHVEIIEFLLEVVGRTATLPPSAGKRCGSTEKEVRTAVVRIPEQNRRVEGPEQIRQELAGIGIDYERWTPAHELPADAASAEILDAYASEIERLKASGGYTTADVIDIKPDTPGLDAMLAKFNREHWHDEDEVRFIIEGRGLFHIHPRNGPVVAIEVEAGDLIRVPRSTWHWFDLCAERRVRAIRLFQDVAGWTPHYTVSGVDREYEPVCFGPAYLPHVPTAS